MSTPVQRSRGREETRQERLNRELIELLNELRVILPGVQVFFAFLLTVPFSQGFTSMNEGQRRVYFVGMLLTALSSIFLIAPTSYHRIRFRQRDKEQMVRTSNRLALVGTLFLAGAMTVVVFLITDFLYGGTWAKWVTAAVAGILVGFWYALPIVRRLNDDTADSDDEDDDEPHG